MSRFRLPRTLAGVAIAVLAFSVAIAPAATAQSARSTVVGAVSGRSVVVTQVDSGHSYTLAVGDRLTVKLSGVPNATWTMPSTTNRKVLIRKSGRASGTSATASFLAIAAGRANVFANDELRCFPQCYAVTTHTFHVAISVT